MTTTPPIFIKVTAVIGADTVFVSELVAKQDICSSLGANDRVVRSKAMAKAGAGTFWKVSGEHVTHADKDGSAVKHHLPMLVSGSAVSFANSFAAQPNVTLPLEFWPKPKTSSSETKSYKNERQLKVAYTSKADPSLLVADLVGTGLIVPSRCSLDAIQIDGSRWITSSWLYREENVVRLLPGHLKVAVPLAGVTGEPSTLLTGSGLLIFLDDPGFCDIGKHDFRSEIEVAADTDHWLERISQSVKATDVHRSRIADLRMVLQHYMDETVGAGEMGQLSAAMRVLEGRTELLALIPTIVRQDKTWSSQVDAQLEQEASLRRQEAELAFEAEREALSSELLGVQDQIKQGHLELLLIGQRRQAYEDVRRDLEQAINTAVKAELATLDTAQDFVRRPELQSMESELQALKAPVPGPVHGGEAVPETLALPAPPTYDLMPEKDRQSFLTELARASGTKYADLLMLIASRGTGRLPVLTGVGASNAASAIVQGLSPVSPMMIFCDPTIVSMQDLLNTPGIDGEQTLRQAIAFARSAPEVLVPFGLHALTKSPCEFWLQPLLIGQHAGHLPANMLFVGSTEPDGNRISVPPSMLDRLFPIETTLQPGNRPGMKKVQAAWPSGSTQPGPEFIQGLLDLNLGADRLREVKNSAAGLLSLFECDIEAFKEGIGTQVSWLSSLGQTGNQPHPQMRHFAPLEN